MSGRRGSFIEGFRAVAPVLVGIVPFGLVAAADAVVAWRTESILATIVVGMGVLVGLQAVF